MIPTWSFPEHMISTWILLLKSMLKSSTWFLILGASSHGHVILLPKLFIILRVGCTRIIGPWFIEPHGTLLFGWRSHGRTHGPWLKGICPRCKPNLDQRTNAGFSHNPSLLLLVLCTKYAHCQNKIESFSL